MPTRQHRCMKRRFSVVGRIRSTPGNLPEGSDQFNSLQEKLIERFAELREQYGFQLLHLTCCRDTVEDRGTIQYSYRTARPKRKSPPNFSLYRRYWSGEKGQFTGSAGIGSLRT